MRGRLFSELLEPELSSLAILSESMLAILEEPAFSLPAAEEQSEFVVLELTEIVVGGFLMVGSVGLCATIRDAEHLVAPFTLLVIDGLALL